MSSSLHFSPVFKPSLSLSDIPPSPCKSLKKRKRDLEQLNNNDVGGGGDGFEADSDADGTSLPSMHSSAFVTTSLVASDVETSHGYNRPHSPISGYVGHEVSHSHNTPPSFPHHITETIPLIAERRISDELATLKPPLYLTTRRVPNVTVEKFMDSAGLRQHHLKGMTAVLHRCLSECDYIRAGRAWAMLLRAKQRGQSMDLRTHDRWGVGAEILMQRESRMAYKTLEHNFENISDPTFKRKMKPEILEKAKEYYERIGLQYPYQKAFPNALRVLNFSIAMFSLWIYTVKDWSSIASNEGIDKAVLEANDDVQSSFASDIERDRYQKREQVKKDTLKSAYEIAARLNRLLVSPPYSDNANLWKLCGEVFLWIADLLAAPTAPSYGSSIRGVDGDQTTETSSLLRNGSRSTSLSEEYRAGQERQTALAKAEEAFKRVKVYCKSSTE